MDGIKSKGVTEGTMAQRKRPACVDQLLAASDAAEAHAFLFHGGGTDDYMRPGIDLRQYLARMFSPGYKVVVSYSVSRGFRFGGYDQAQPNSAEMRKQFHEILGMEDKTPDQPLLAAPAPAVALLLKLMRVAKPNSVIVMLDHLENMVGEKVPVDGAMIGLMEMLHDAGTEETIAQSGNLLIMFSPTLTEIKESVRSVSSGIKMIEVPLPTTAQRLDFVTEWLGTEPTPIKMVGITESNVATLTAGLYLRHVETVLLRARENNHTLTRELALAVQREMMDTEYAGIIKRVERQFHLTDVGGHVEAKAYGEKHIARAQAGKRTSNAILWAGPPGTGKTMIAAALANDSGQNCLEVDFSTLLGSLVGHTEKQLAKLKECAMSNAPCQIICDEIDQKIRRGEGGPDSGGGGAVENRLFSSVLELVESLKDYGVTWHFMTNRPEILDEAFMSRMATVIPLLPAESDEARADVLTRIVARFKGTLSSEAALTFAGRMVNWSGRDIEHVVTDSMAMAEDDGLTLEAAMDETITYRRVKVLDTKTMVAQALDYCKDTRLIPAKYRDAVNQADEAKPVAGTKRMGRVTAVADWPGAQ